MKHWKSMIFAAALALPFSVLGNASVAVDESAAPAVVEVDGTAPEAYNCCWVYMNGRWWCFYC